MTSVRGRMPWPGFHGALLAAQRLGGRLPAPIRRLARRLLPSPRGEITLPGWTSPLIGDGILTWPAVEVVAPAFTARTDDDAMPVMRCLLVTGTLDAGGMDEFVAFLAHGLPRHGVRTAVLLAPLDHGMPAGAIVARLRAAGIEVFDGAADPAGAQAWMGRWRPDVVAVHGNATWPVDEAVRRGIPVVLVLHGMHDLFGASEEEVLGRCRKMTRVVCVSELVRLQYLSRSARIDPHKVVTVPNGIDASRITGVGRSAARAALGLTSEFLFVSLSRHALQKNTYGLVAAFGDLAETEPDVHLLVCGRADDLAYTSQVVALRERLSSRGRIHLRAGTTRPDVVLAAADAFVLDSFFEGWALASMEALVAGVPVILSEVGGAYEQVAGEPVRGVVVPNPLGDVLAADWRSIGPARFTRQVNREELVDAMRAVSTRSLSFADRAVIAADAARRFDPQVCVARHARVLLEAAGMPAAEPSRQSGVPR